MTVLYISPWAQTLYGQGLAGNDAGVLLWQGGGRPGTSEHASFMKHFGFSVESETRLLTKKDREALGQYVVRGATSQEKIR